MNNARILYSDERAVEDSETDYLRIVSVRVENDYIYVNARSDVKVVDLYLDGRLCCRQKGSGAFEFMLPIDCCGGAQMLLAAKDDPKLSKGLKLDI